MATSRVPEVNAMHEPNTEGSGRLVWVKEPDSKQRSRAALSREAYLLTKQAGMQCFEPRNEGSLTLMGIGSFDKVMH